MRLFFAFAFLVVLSIPAFSQVPPATRPGGNGMVSVFAYPGTVCPAHATPYKGPENFDAMKSGAIYCVFRRSVTPVPKAQNDGNCPVGLTAYVDPNGARPPDDVIWCRVP